MDCYPEGRVRLKLASEHIVAKLNVDNIRNMC